MDPRRPRLGELLLGEGKITAQQLDRALRAQEQIGARLGTNLVELDLLSVLELGAALSRQRGVPEAHPNDFLGASRRLLDQFPRDLAAKHWVFTLRVHDKVLHLAMIDPQNVDQISEVTFVSGLRVAPLVAPQLRMLFFLEQRFGLARPPRFATSRQTGPFLGVPAARPDPTGPVHPAVVAGIPLQPVDTRPGYHAAAAPAPPPQAPEEDPDLVYLDDVPHGFAAAPDDDFEVTVDPGFQAIAAGGTKGAAAAAPAPAGLPQGLEAVRIALSRARDRGAVAALAVRPVLSQPSVSVLFRVQKEAALALATAPCTVPFAEVRRLELPLSPGSLLQRAQKTGEPVRAPASTDPLQKILSAYLRAPEPGEVCVAPVLVSRRVVSLICVQLPAGAALDEADAARLAELAGAVAGAYVRLIREAKGRG